MCRAIDLLPKVSSNCVSSNRNSSSSPPLFKTKCKRWKIIVTSFQFWTKIHWLQLTWITYMGFRINLYPWHFLKGFIVSSAINTYFKSINNYLNEFKLPLRNSLLRILLNFNFKKSNVAQYFISFVLIKKFHFGLMFR